jgi:hypothetical protein
MPNKRRGEIEGILDGRPFTLCLTLGALAELEASFGDENMLALAKRFESGRLSARDCIRIIAAGLSGAGLDTSEEAVARMQAEGGVGGYVDIVARLLRATFGGGDGADAPAPTPTSTQNPTPTRPPGAVRAHSYDETAADEPQEMAVSGRPFPGTT